MQDKWRVFDKRMPLFTAIGVFTTYQYLMTELIRHQFRRKANIISQDAHMRGHIA